MTPDQFQSWRVGLGLTQAGAARLALATLESERAANALLTEELDLTRLGK